MVRILRLAVNLAACAALLLPTGIALASGSGGAPGGGTTAPGGGTGGGGTGGGSATGGGAGTIFAGLSLTVSSETAPPGGIAQMKVLLTEPKPMGGVGGGVHLGGFTAVSGIAVMGPTTDVTGVAVVRGNDVTISILSPSATYGTTLEYPVLTVAGRVAASNTIGAIFPVTLDGLVVLDGAGTPYPIEVSAGRLTVTNGVAIGDVNPGSAIVPAGGVVAITGNNFLPTTTIRFGTGRIQTVRYISPTEIDVVMATSVNMHGNQIKAANPDKSQSTYYSYQRTYPVTLSSDPVLQFAMPLFSPVSVSTATITLPAPQLDRINTYGVGLQNVGTVDAVATVELLDADSNPIAVSTITIAPSHYAVRELSELFGLLPAGATGVRVTSSSTPIEVMGVVADQLFGTVSPILAH
jgi:hypothetical protein